MSFLFVCLFELPPYLFEIIKTRHYDVMERKKKAGKEFYWTPSHSTFAVRTYIVTMSLVVEAHFQHILRMLNTNIDGRQKIMYALTSIRGIGRRFSNLVCKKADIDMTKRYFTLSFTLRRVIKPELFFGNFSFR